MSDDYQHFRREIGSGAVGDPALHYEMALAFREMEIWSEALIEFRAAMTDISLRVPSLEGAAECHRQLGEQEEARTCLRQALDLLPADSADALRVQHRLSTLDPDDSDWGAAPAGVAR